MLKNKRIALDIDGVLCDFGDGVINRAKEMNLEVHFPITSRHIQKWDICDKFTEVMEDAWLDKNFWLNLKPINKSRPLLINPVAYITSRPISTKVTEQWLDRWGFPPARVITVEKPTNKLRHLKQLNVDMYVDDLHTTIIQLRRARINAILFEAPYQISVKEECKELPTIKNLKELEKYV